MNTTFDNTFNTYVPDNTQHFPESCLETVSGVCVLEATYKTTSLSQEMESAAAGGASWFPWKYLCPAGLTIRDIGGWETGGRGSIHAS